MYNMVFNSSDVIDEAYLVGSTTGMLSCEARTVFGFDELPQPTMSAEAQHRNNNFFIKKVI
ncbi:hypothetical protein GCM10008085_22710 [Winogradskyella epiphytica]|nr:hypothetical protein GCM10008085_22710 [Winogradskyella epiphytica]